ncbi:MAG: hypothetical protein MUO26_11010 [Methanotrichaceae archaeon]|nr:hypothetical protein [Methanotrichaceae archaeon]
MGNWRSVVDQIAKISQCTCAADPYEANSHPYIRKREAVAHQHLNDQATILYTLNVVELDGVGSGTDSLPFSIGVIKVRVKDWYKNGSLNAFRKFCIQSRKKLVSVKLVKGSEPVKGILYRYRFLPFESAGIYLLLTNAANHPAFYSLYDIESLHHLDSVSSIVTTPANKLAGI